MAEAIYEVNIKLNAQNFEQELNTLKKKLERFTKEAKRKNEKDPIFKKGRELTVLKSIETTRNKLNELDRFGLNTDKRRAKLRQAENLVAKGKFRTAKNLVNEAQLLNLKDAENLRLAKERLAEEKKLKRERQMQQKLASKRFGSVIKSAGIGGGFPLLFGGGIPGAIAGGLGGGIGEALSPGGGFAGSIVATAVVRMMTDFTNGITEVGKAMNESSKEFDRVQNILGKDGANKISAFATQTELLTKTFGDFFLNVQSGVAGLLNMGGVLNGLIAMMQRDVARRQAARSDEFKRRTKGLKGQGGQGIKRRKILAEETDREFELNVQNFANQQAEIGEQLLNKELQGLERKLELEAADNHKMAEAIGLRHKQVDIIDSLVAAGAVLSEQDKERIGDLLRENQLLEDKKDLELFLKENAKEMKSLEDEDQKNYDDAIKKLDKLKESSNSVTKNLEDQNKLNLIKLSGSEYEIALAEKTLGYDKEKLATFDEEAFKIAYNNKLRIDGLIKQKQITEDIKNIMAQDMGNAIKGLITGTQSLNDSLRNVLNNMANAFLNLGIFGNIAGTFTRGASGGLLGAIFRAEGGPVKGGKSYIVGERGPEMFSPGVSGMITPNHALGGSTNVVVNVDASGSSVEGDEQQGRELGRLISVAVQSELVQQKRPGGLLA